MGGFYTTDASYTFSVARYPGGTTLTCAEALQALKDTDANNSDATGFIAYGMSDGVNYEVRPFTYKGADAIYIRDNADGYPESSYNIVCFYIVNGIQATVQSRQYYQPITSGGVLKFNGYRNSSYTSYNYDSQIYNGTGKNDTSYAEPFIYISNLDAFGDVYFNGEPLVSYTWSSVPAISGKNGILHLSTLTDINDGNPVSTSDTTKFTLQEASNIKTLVGGDAVPNVSASGGGAAGSDPQYGGQAVTGKSGTQSTGYAFGQGEAPGGGGGFYGGYGGEADVSPAGAGSGYIGNSLLTNKKMYGYGVAKNTSASAYTISKSDHSIAAIEKKPKAGNGYAKITYLRPLSAPPAWDGNFFNADFSTDGRDSVRYDSSRTCSVTIDTSAMEPRTALQGQMIDCFEDIPVWTLSNGVLDIGNNEAAYLGWLYDYANIDNKIIPPTSTFYIDMEVYCYQADTIELGFFTPINHDGIVDRKVFLFGINSGLIPYVETEDVVGATSDYQIGNTALSFNTNEWHAIRCKIEMVDSYISKITVYLDGSEVTYKEFNSLTEPLSFVCINNNATYKEWFCRLRAFSCKIRKLSVGQDVS